MPRKRATIADIARIAGVSPGAVSFALNGKPGVSEQTRQRVLAIADELAWRPSRAARALGGARVGVVGLVVERSPRALGTEAFFTDLIAGLQAGLAGTDVAMQLLVVADVEDEIRTYRAWHASSQVDGVVVLDPRDEDPRLVLLTELGMPAVVLASSPTPVGGATSVWIDDAQAARRLFDHVAGLGHRQIGYITGPAEHQHTRLRVGVLDGLASRGVSGLHIATDFSAAAAIEATRRMLTTEEPPTAIVYDNEVMAIAGLRVAQTLHRAVPSDLSIASFDDSVISEHIHPSITSLTRDTVELGRRAARQLLAQLDQPDEQLAGIEGPEPTLSARESSARPSARDQGTTVFTEA